jgi:excisionase family DNA binding protein
MKLLKLSEVRQTVGVSRATVWRWIAERGLKVVRIGDVTRVRESDLEAFLKRHESVEPVQLQTGTESAETE